MDITPLVPQNKQIITGYGGGGFKINNQFIAGSLLVFAEQTLPWIATVDAFTIQSFDKILQAEGIELLLVGTGDSIVPLDPSIRSAFKARNIRVDVMDTGAACRTYNVLMSEERRVAAALVAV